MGGKAAFRQGRGGDAPPTETESDQARSGRSHRVDIPI